MQLRPGVQIWIPCEVRPGPFSDERLIRVRSNSGEWVGFVSTESLKEPVKEGKSLVRAVVTEVSSKTFTAEIRGEPVSSRVFRGEVSQVTAVGSL
jgi:hypothetical protein